MHKHSFKQSDGGCFLVGDDTFPCDITYRCQSCPEKFKLNTTKDGYTYLPETFETGEISDLHKNTIEMINEQTIDPTNPL